jgi:transcriptional regulator with XRE-family HTH domain
LRDKRKLTNDHMEIIDEFNKLIAESKKNSKRITQVQISEATGINRPQLSVMLKDGRGMYLQYACAIAKALGVKLVIEKRRKETHVDKYKRGEKIDTDLRKALESEQENSKSLRKQIEWLRLEYERLRQKRNFNKTQDNYT